MQYSTGVGTRGGTLVNGWKGALLKDWTLTTNITIASGTAADADRGRRRSRNGRHGSHRQRAGGCHRAGRSMRPPPASPSTWRHSPIPLPGMWGTAGRDTITGPTHLRPERVASAASSASASGAALDLRFDATNALNHVTFPRWNTTVGATQFGALPEPGAMRSHDASL